jgi:hypothetical protein
MRGEDTRQAAIEYAWRTFASTTWPSRADATGVPIEAHNPERYGDFDDGALPAFVTWKTEVDLFPNLGGQALKWHSPDTAQTCKQSRARGMPVSATLQVDQSPLVDQEGEYVYYSIHFNQSFYGYIFDSAYHDARNWPAHGLNFPSGSPNQEPPAMTKFSWRDVTALSEEEQAPFFVIDGSIYDPASCAEFRKQCDCVPSQLALVGAHITTKLAGYQQWIWATFGHRGNLNTWDGEAPSFQAEPSEANPAAHPAYSYRPATTLIADPLPVNVVRIVPIPEAIQAENAYVAATFTKDTIWENYELTALQYPRDENRPAKDSIHGTGCDLLADGTITPSAASGDFDPPCGVSNVTMETYMPQSSCASCHAGAAAQRADYSYIVANNAALAQ